MFRIRVSVLSPYMGQIHPVYARICEKYGTVHSRIWGYFSQCKGRVSFNPKTQKTSKKKVVKPAKSVETDSFDTTVEEDGNEKEEVETVNQDIQEREDSDIPEKMKRKTSRKKKNIANSGGDVEEETEKKLKNILEGLHNIYLKEKTFDRHSESNDSGFLSLNSIANGPDVNEVFKFMVKILKGKGTPEEIKRESGVFPFDFDEKSWFRKLKRRFTVIERNGDIEIVLVSNRYATYCLDYITNRSCNKADCNRYHVCKNLLAGNCIHGDGCKFSHDLLDERNMIVSKRLGYGNVFTSEEICYILQVRFPHICHNWIDSGFCEDPFCIGLHLCPRYLLSQCLEGDSCPLVHDRCSDHNKPIVAAYDMTDLVESTFKKLVYMKRQPEGESQMSEPGESASSVRNRNSSLNKPELDDSADEMAICDKYIIGKCRRHHCKFLHCTILSPYLWQVKLCGQWLNLDDFEEIEKAYCENKKFSDVIRVICNNMEFSVVMVFKPNICAVAVVNGTQDDRTHTEARRLSTVSYKQDDDDSTGSFRTQWRWYWRDDYQEWKLFDQDAMQHTLEVKFLAKQKDFNYSRENYSFEYVIDFEDMKQRNIGTRKIREISRRPIFVPQGHIQGKQYPGCLSVAPLVETPLPRNWVPWDLVHPFELITIENNSKTYKWVSDSFFKTLSRTELEIDAIFRVQNHKLRSLYCNQEKSMLANLKRLGKEGHIEQRNLFHGTDSIDAVRGICINNLDNRVSGKNATAYGDGAYFARDSRYSHAYTGNGPERFMFLVTVLVGDYTLGNRSYRRPPNKPGNDHEPYDSCVDKVDNPSIFIVFDKNQYYPEYLIQYHKLYEESPAGVVQKTPKPSVSGHIVPSRTPAPSDITSGTDSWNSCIKRNSKEDVSKLVEKKILPSKKELNEVCRIFGRKSQIISDVCSMIGQNIKSSSDNIIDVWPSYPIDYGYSENNISIVFVITIKRNSECPVVIDYEYHIKFKHEVSNEGKDVVIYEQKRLWRSSDDDILEKMRLCINKHSDGLFEKHRNLNVILPSLCRSTGYKSSHKEIKDEPCIALYVTVKGYIPLNEDPFVNQLDCYKIDVLEGDFDPYIGGRPNDYHEHLKMGLAIHANSSNGSGIEGGTLGGFIDHSVHGLCGITCAHVLFNSEELTEIKENKSFRSKQVYQPIEDRSAAFGEVVEAAFEEGNTSLPGMEFALIKINDRIPTDGSFPDVLNDVESGFDDENPMLFNSGDVCETSHLRRRNEVYKFGISTGITRGSFELRGAAVRKRPMDGQHHGFGFRLKNQIAILQIGNHPFAEHGDSGSLVLMEGEQDSIAIGIVEGGIDGRTFLTPICDILRAADCSELRMHRFDIINRLQENLQPHEDMES